MSDINVVVKENEPPKPIPEGTYKAVVKSLEEKEGQFGKYVKIEFEITEGENKGTLRSAVASKKFSLSKSGKNSKLYNLLGGFFKDKIASGETIRLNEVIGKKCQILIVNGKEVDGIVWQNVGKVFLP